MMIDCEVPSTFIERKARSAIAYRCGGSTPIDLPRYVAHLLLTVARQRLVWVHRDQDVAGVGVDEVLAIAVAQVEEK